MKTYQTRWLAKEAWSLNLNSIASEAIDLILVFSSSDQLDCDNHPALNQLIDKFPNAVISGCSTAGEIYDDTVLQGAFTATLCDFDKATVSGVLIQLPEGEDGSNVGESIAQNLSLDGLKHLLVFSDGLVVNGTALSRSIAEVIPEGVSITGGLAAVEAKFEKTYVIHRGEIFTNAVTIIGLYGENLIVGHGCEGGWTPFGVEREVTRSKDNTLYELDGEPALDLYKRYLGDHAKALPSSGLLFPLSVTEPGNPPLVRTLLGIDEPTKSLIFAGDIPQGARARLMLGNLNKLISGAQNAAENSTQGFSPPPDLTLAISCVGRQLVLKNRVDEEIDSLRHVIGNDGALCGFYSYGELAPSRNGDKSGLHNQTMTITTIAEVDADQDDSANSG